MVQKNNFKGVITPVSTIFNDEGTFDRDGMKELIDYLIDAKVNGLLFLGSGGEFSQMNIEQRKEVAEFCISYVNGRVPTLVGTGGNNTNECVELSKHAESIEADGIIVINPYYWNLSETGLFKHFSSIANSVNIPMLLYNFPNVTGQDLNAEFVHDLVQNHENIVGIKETIDSAVHIRDMILKVKNKFPNFKVFAGFDDYMLSTLQSGGDGAILGSSNFASEISVQLYTSFLEEDFKKSMENQRKLNELPTIYGYDSPFLNSIKEATKLRGLNISTNVLEPAQKLDEEKVKNIEGVLNSVSLTVKKS